MASPNQDQSYTYTADLLSGPLFFGAIGFGIDRWLGSSGHPGVIGGLVLGLVMGLYAVWIRYRRDMAAIDAHTMQHGIGQHTTSRVDQGEGIQPGTTAGDLDRPGSNRSPAGQLPGAKGQPTEITPDTQVG